MISAPGTCVFLPVATELERRHADDRSPFPGFQIKGGFTKLPTAVAEAVGTCHSTGHPEFV
jgi:hypothetical protein